MTLFEKRVTRRGCASSFCRERWLAAIGIAALSTGCQLDVEPEPLAPPDVETVRVYASNRIEVFIEPELAFCQGDGARMDAHVIRLSEDLGIAPPPSVSVYVLGDDAGAVIADWCFGNYEQLGGCFQSWMAVAKVWAVSHELNHAVLRTLNPDASSESRFWAEAYASAWEIEESYFDVLGLSEQVTDSAFDGGGHLVRWLSDTAGTDAVAKFYASIPVDGSRSEVDAIFVQSFGQTYSEALSNYEEFAPLLYPGYAWCDGAEVIDVPLGESHASFRADCQAMDTYAFADPPITAMYVRRTLRVAERADLRIEYSSASGVLTRHPCLETPVESENDPRLSGDNWNEHISPGVPPMGMVSTMDNIEAGDHAFEFVVPLGPPVEVEVTIFADPPAGN